MYFTAHSKFKDNKSYKIINAFFSLLSILKCLSTFRFIIIINLLHIVSCIYPNKIIRM